VIDVCEAEEFAAGHVGGAKNIPLASWKPKAGLGTSRTSRFR
jgi:rhodanese-related sulfurtransferase